MIIHSAHQLIEESALDKPYEHFMKGYFFSLVRNYFESPEESQYLNLFSNIIINNRMNLVFNMTPLGFGIYFDHKSGYYINNRLKLKLDPGAYRPLVGLQVREKHRYFIQCCSKEGRINAHEILDSNTALHITTEFNKFLKAKTQDHLSTLIKDN